MRDFDNIPTPKRESIAQTSEALAAASRLSVEIAEALTRGMPVTQREVAERDSHREAQRAIAMCRNGVYLLRKAATAAMTAAILTDFLANALASRPAATEEGGTTDAPN